MFKAPHYYDWKDWGYDVCINNSVAVILILASGDNYGEAFKNDESKLFKHFSLAFSFHDNVKWRWKKTNNQNIDKSLHVNFGF